MHAAARTSTDSPKPQARIPLRFWQGGRGQHSGQLRRHFASTVQRHVRIKKQNLEFGIILQECLKKIGLIPSAPFFDPVLRILKWPQNIMEMH